MSEPKYALPMVGRKRELALIGEKLELALAGHGQVVGIIAEAGMGKSRLLAEAIRLARRKGLRGGVDVMEKSGEGQLVGADQARPPGRSCLSSTSTPRPARAR